MTNLSSSASHAHSRRRSFLVVVVLLLLSAGLLAALFLGRLTFLSDLLPATSDHGAGNVDTQISTVVTYDMRETLDVVLNSGQESNRVYLNLSVSFKLSRPQDVPFVRNLEPAIRDTIIPYLQELRPQELEGSRGIFLLREELLFRVNKVTGSVRIEDVYITALQLQ